MAPKKHVSLIFFRRIHPSEEASCPDIEVLLSQRGAFQFKDASSKPQSFSRGMQIFPGGKLEDSDQDSWHCAMRELREEGGSPLYDWVKALLEMDLSRLSLVDDHCYAIEVAQDELEKFMSLIKLAPEHSSVGWYPFCSIIQFGNLAPYKDGVPKGVKAIFADEAGWIKKLVEMVSQEK